MPDEYRIALAYSNIQRGFSVPSFISGVIAHEDDHLELEKRNLPRKRLLMHRKYSLSSLQDTFDDVAHYLTYHLVLPLNVRWSTKDFEDRYIKILNILRHIHLRVISGHVRSISIRALGAYDAANKKWHTVAFTEDFIDNVSKFSPKYEIVEEKGDRLFEVARILARLEYERNRTFGNEYVMSRVEKEPSAYFQIIKVKYDSPQISEYNSDRVGSPALVIRTSQQPMIRHVYLDKGTKLSFDPLAKFCRGGQNGRQPRPCQYSDVGNPFGLPLIGSSDEQCNKCRNLSEYSICLYRKPLCNGYQVKCGNVEFAGNICCGLYALYVIRLGGDLKVGTAILSNVVGRLLEQGASYALVVYPLESIIVAHTLEKIIRDNLENDMAKLNKLGVKSVYRRAPPKKEIVRNFLQDWYRNDEELLRFVLSRISQASAQIDGLKIDLSQAEHKICRLLDNYIKPYGKKLDTDLRSRRFFGSVNGSVVGYRGSILFLNSGKIVDLDQLQGFVVRGSL